jgi:hypothetical protein
LLARRRKWWLKRHPLLTAGAQTIYESTKNTNKQCYVSNLIYINYIMLFSYGSGQHRIDGNIKIRQIDGNFDCHGNAAVQRGAYHPMEHIQGFTRSHWMPPLGECLRRIAPAAAMVDGFVETTLNTNKTQLLASNYGTF